jgi:predicted Co/Zn/Cd cation transporter (cation efflux family)
MLVLLGSFLIAAIVSVAASVTVGLVLTSLLVSRLVETADRPSRVTYLATCFGDMR